MVRAGVQVTEKKEVLAMENEGDAHIVWRESQMDIASSDVLSCEETADAAVPRPLSVRRLVVRRGLTVLFMVLILAAGILTHQMLLKHK
ncbi:multidrug and toxin extrusion protein 1-like [Perca fluviatilis]|uniref:multidrug and toxin extrusion protein 1-like n=1 Tax=Perca fluviatilis TaxID=8168 RepID=UPI0019660C63|nr:multidrug and toxin extrusion protein 1-like [Perca fluviatilis]XP_039672442.1 multidrug and toxin extrusion protein 1-like [Perca fluviatilis]